MIPLLGRCTSVQYLLLLLFHTTIRAAATVVDIIDRKTSSLFLVFLRLLCCFFRAPRCADVACILEACLPRVADRRPAEARLETHVRHLFENGRRNGNRKGLEVEDVLVVGSLVGRSKVVGDVDFARQSGLDGLPIKLSVMPLTVHLSHRAPFTLIKIHWANRKRAMNQEKGKISTTASHS